MRHNHTTATLFFAAIVGTFIGVPRAETIGADGTAQATPLRRAHAHNDYYHERPLLDALSHGFCSVEADIFLVDGNLLVGHSRNELDPNRTLERLYLAPLRRLVKQNGGRVYPDGPVVTLLIDIKSEGTSTYRALEKVLTRYAPMLTTVEEGKEKRNAVHVVISGNRDFKTIEASEPRYAGIDGRLSDLDSNHPSHLMPMISDNWGKHFRWRGEGPIPTSEREKLQMIVKKAHDAGRTVRFWATPERETIWQELLSADVDHINTDDLARLRTFLLREDNKSAKSLSR